MRPAQGGADVRRGRAAWGWLWLCAAAAALSLACGDPDTNPTPPDDGQEPVGQVQAQGQQTDAGPPPEITLEVPLAELGDHLVATDFWVPVPDWLGASADAVVAALPARARASSGTLFEPSVDSPTQESFWLHVMTDESPQAALDWVLHLASQDPAIAGTLTPGNHEVFGAAIRPAPAVGDASVWIELLHGHDNGCWRSDLLVFAQDGLVILLRNGIEVSSETGQAQGQPAARGPALCAAADEVASLTDLNRIAQLISERLYALYSNE